MQRFTVTTEGTDKLGLRQLCEQVVNDLWVPAHLTPEEACHFVQDHFRRSVLAELELLDVQIGDNASRSTDS